MSASFGSAAGALLVADDRISGASGKLAGAITHTHSIGADKLGRIPDATWRGRVRGRDVSAAQIKQGSGQEYRVLMSLGGCPKHDDVKGRARTGRVLPTASEPAASVAALETSGRVGLSPDGDVAGVPAVGTGSYPFFILCRSLRLNRFGRKLLVSALGVYYTEDSGINPLSILPPDWPPAAILPPFRPLRPLSSRAPLPCASSPCPPPSAAPAGVLPFRRRRLL